MMSFGGKWGRGCLFAKNYHKDDLRKGKSWKGFAIEK
jgi:hypothetical protein